MEDARGRRIWWAWIREKRSAKSQAMAGWAGVISLPRLLTLHSGGVLEVEPVPELKILRRESRRISGLKIEPDGPLLLKRFESDCFEIEAEIDMGSSHQAGVRVRSTADGSEQTLIGYDRDSQKLFSDTTSSSKDPDTEESPPFIRERVPERRFESGKGRASPVAHLHRCVCDRDIRKWQGLARAIVFIQRVPQALGLDSSPKVARLVYDLWQSGNCPPSPMTG